MTIPRLADGAVRERRAVVRTDAGDLMTRYLVAGPVGAPPLVLLHGDGDSAISWRWVMPALASSYRVYAPDFPGFGDSAKPAPPQTDYSPSFFARFLGAFLDALGHERAVVIGSSLGGLVAIRFALDAPERVTALGLVGSAGLGRAINPGFPSLTIPGWGELAIAWAKTPLGAEQRAWWRSVLLFANPGRVPAAWLAEQDRLARLPGFMEATVAALRAVVDPGGQRYLVLGELSRLSVPTLVAWGTDDLVFPAAQARAAVARLPRGRLALIPDCGHLPHVECPDRFVAALAPFLAEGVQPAQFVGRAVAAVG